MSKVMRAIPALLLLAALAACARHYEAGRFPSPDGSIEAVLRGADLGGDHGIELRLLPKGADAASGEPVISFAGLVGGGEPPGVHVQWLQPDLLLVRYGDARRVQQRDAAVAVGKQRVRVQVQPGASD